MDNKAKPSNDYHLIIVAGLFALIAAVDKFIVWFLVWIKPIEHRIIFSVLVGSLFAGFMYLFLRRTKKMKEKNKNQMTILGPAEDAVFCGVTDKNENVFIKTKQRSMHTQIIGTTNAGKTESVILPWAIQDIEQGRGLILIDGKSDSSLLNKLWAYVEKSGRQKDFRLFSLGSIEQSHQFNPLIGGTPEEIAERVFNSFEFENPHYRSLQYEVFSQVLRVFEAKKEIPTFLRIHQAITRPPALVAMARDISDKALIEWTEYFRDLPPNERVQRTSGLTAAISHFAFGRTACLFNAETPAITLEDALEKNLIVYFQLPVLLSPFLGKASGKLILQSLQSAVANRHRGSSENKKFFSVFLDDFSEYLYPGFVSVLNKSRSANVGIVFAHQALGDIKTLGDAISNTILTNANLKVFMRGNDPDSAEYFAKVIGTAKGTKYTERRKKGFIDEQSTGDVSAREVEEFIVHPNRFKNELGVGEAVMIVPHDSGSSAINIRFRKYDDLKGSPLEKVPKMSATSLSILMEEDKSNSKQNSLNERGI
ncbi:MAG: type IV secretory system conjugative DNA transfer family protein [Bdellovibrionales bacterium]